MENALQTIRFHYLTPAFYFPDRNRLKSFIKEQLQKGGKKVEAINYIFCNDAYLLEINEQYLQHDTYTDIITFELSQNGMPLLADIYISVERVKENSGKYRTTFIEELRRVVFHGALHLAGFKDKSKTDAVEMRNKENEWMKMFDVPREIKKKSKD